jgi:hypothetical protein
MIEFPFNTIWNYLWGHRIRSRSSMIELYASKPSKHYDASKDTPKRPSTSFEDPPGMRVTFELFGVTEFEAGLRRSNYMHQSLRRIIMIRKILRSDPQLASRTLQE